MPDPRGSSILDNLDVDAASYRAVAQEAGDVANVDRNLSFERVNGGYFFQHVSHLLSSSVFAIDGSAQSQIAQNIVEALQFVVTLDDDRIAGGVVHHPLGQLHHLRIDPADVRVHQLPFHLAMSGQMKLNNTIAWNRF